MQRLRKRQAEGTADGKGAHVQSNSGMFERKNEGPNLSGNFHMETRSKWKCVSRRHARAKWPNKKRQGPNLFGNIDMEA